MRRSTVISGAPVRSRASSFSAAVVVGIDLSRRDSTPAGLPMECQHGLDPSVLGRTHCAAQGDTHLSPHWQFAGCAAPLLRHKEIESTVRYLGVEVDAALAIAEQVDV